MSRHERRKIKAMQRKSPGVFTQEWIPVSELKDVGLECAWAGCEAHFKAHGADKPQGWTSLILYQGKTKMNFLDIPPKDCLRDAVLCPEHTQLLDRQLKDLGRVRPASCWERIMKKPTDKLKALRMWVDHWGFTLRRSDTGYALYSRYGDGRRVNFQNQSQIKRWLDKWGRDELRRLRSKGQR